MVERRRNAASTGRLHQWKTEPLLRKGLPRERGQPGTGVAWERGVLVSAGLERPEMVPEAGFWLAGYFRFHLEPLSPRVRGLEAVRSREACRSWPLLRPFHAPGKTPAEPTRKTRGFGVILDFQAEMFGILRQSRLPVCHARFSSWTPVISISPHKLVEWIL